jgi:hypothetical protein
MKHFLENMKDSKYRCIMYDDIVEMMLKGGASLELAQSLLLITYEYYKDTYTEEFLENQVLRVHETILEDGGYKQKRNIQQEVSDVVSFRGSGLINIADLYNDLKLAEPHDKSACRMAINRMVTRRILEKVDGGKSGTYRLIDNNTEQTTFLTEPKGEFKVHLPLDLHTMCKIFPQNIIIVAGSKSAGKTAFLLNVALDNQNKHDVIYLNSEMGDEEFTERMIKLGCNSPADIKFRCYKKSSNYQDLINGNKAIYIIDFLEIHDKFYEIGKTIKLIHDKLKDGIAIIGIQMKGGERLGRGGDFSKEVSRLYLSLDYQQEKKCTRFGIEEMKSPKVLTGYRGWYRYAKIIDGSRLSPMGKGWTDVPEEEKRAVPVYR